MFRASQFPDVDNSKDQYTQYRSVQSSPSSKWNLVMIQSQHMQALAEANTVVASQSLFHPPTSPLHLLVGTESEPKGRE